MQIRGRYRGYGLHAHFHYSRKWDRFKQNLYFDVAAARQTVFASIAAGAAYAVTAVDYPLASNREIEIGLPQGCGADTEQMRDGYDR